MIPLAGMVWLSGRGGPAEELEKKTNNIGYFNLGMAIFEAHKWLLLEM